MVEIVKESLEEEKGAKPAAEGMKKEEVKAAKKLYEKRELEEQLADEIFNKIVFDIPIPEKPATFAPMLGSSVAKVDRLYLRFAMNLMLESR